MKHEASQMYHTACIYYKVMIAMVPTVAGTVTPKLQVRKQVIILVTLIINKLLFTWFKLAGKFTYYEAYILINV